MEEKKKTPSKKTTTSKPKSKTTVKKKTPVKKVSKVKVVEPIKEEVIEESVSYSRFKLILLIICSIILLLGIGAAFAYYSIVASSEGGTASVNAKSDEVGNVSLSGEGGNLHINLMPSEISNVAGGVFYGTASEDGYSLYEEKLEVAKVEATALPTNIKYTCTFDIKVTPKDGDLTNVVGGELTFSNINISIEGVDSDKLAFNTLSEEKTYHASTTLDSGDINYLYVSARITSSSENDNEAWLKNINGSFSVSSDNLKCSASKANSDDNNYYTLKGTMKDENGEPLTGYAVVMSDPRVVKLGDDGSFEIKRIEAGTHELYYMGKEDPSELTKEEVKSQTKTKTIFKTANVYKESKKILKLFNRSRMFNVSMISADKFSLYNEIKSDAQNDDINFNVRSGTSGTNGVYTTTSTDNENPVYYYRGNVDNNLIFGGFCWKIIRTTEAGGVRIIYNGTPTNGTCDNTGTSTQISTGVFNSNYNDIAYMGYKYGNVDTTYSDGGRDTTSVKFYCNTPGYPCYSGDSYTLDSSGNFVITNAKLNYWPVKGTYVCMGSSGTCSTLYYNDGNGGVGVYWAYKIKKITTVNSTSYAKANINNYNSSIKSVLESWYNTNLRTNYSSYIADEVFCNDRNMVSGSNSSLGSTYGTIGYGAYKTSYASSSRSSSYAKTLNPTLACKNTNGNVNNNNDAFTASTVLGNGKLSQPIGLITTDEAVMAGFNSYASNSSDYQDNNYLNSGSNYWTMTPVYYNGSNGYYGSISSNGILANTPLSTSSGIRPVITLANGIMVHGDGTIDSPFVVEMD